MQDGLSIILGMYYRIEASSSLGLRYLITYHLRNTSG